MDEKALRIISDHIKAATFILSENIEPSNVEQGYVLRRLIRRSKIYARRLGIEGVFCHKIAKVVIKIYKDAYPELQKNQDFILEQFIKEEERFKETLERGSAEEISQLNKTGGQLTGDVAFNLYESHGLPLEISKEIALSKGFKIDKEIDVYFNERLKKHQELSRKGAEQKFKGGLADHSEQTTKYHTATHLLLASLREVLGDHVWQKGSNITAERLRFDFSHGAKLTAEELKKVEDLVNQKINQDLEVKCEEIDLEEARKRGATGVFGEKYGERVKVYTILDSQANEIFSKEICGGPHVKRTSELGRFIIIKEESPGAGSRRIRAVLE
ncbi:MAG: alanine--tRNA ligase-related protein, partial [bacterium]|nr:alanine--tRNA ligase-related protein [bacterium]